MLNLYELATAENLKKEDDLLPVTKQIASENVMRPLLPPIHSQAFEHIELDELSLDLLMRGGNNQRYAVVGWLIDNKLSLHFRPGLNGDSHPESPNYETVGKQAILKAKQLFGDHYVVAHPVFTGVVHKSTIEQVEKQEPLLKKVDHRVGLSFTKKIAEDGTITLDWLNRSTLNFSVVKISELMIPLFLFSKNQSEHVRPEYTNAYDLQRSIPMQTLTDIVEKTNALIPDVHFQIRNDICYSALAEREFSELANMEGEEKIRAISMAVERNLKLACSLPPEDEFLASGYIAEVRIILNQAYRHAIPISDECLGLALHGALKNDNSSLQEQLVSFYEKQNSLSGEQWLISKLNRAMSNTDTKQEEIDRLSVLFVNHFNSGFFEGARTDEDIQAFFSALKNYCTSSKAFILCVREAIESHIRSQIMNKNYSEIGRLLELYFTHFPGIIDSKSLFANITGSGWGGADKGALEVIGKAAKYFAIDSEFIKHIQHYASSLIAACASHESRIPDASEFLKQLLTISPPLPLDYDFLYQKAKVISSRCPDYKAQIETDIMGILRPSVAEQQSSYAKVLLKSKASSPLGAQPEIQSNSDQATYDQQVPLTRNDSADVVPDSDNDQSPGRTLGC